EVTQVSMRGPAEIERDISACAQPPHGCLILTASALALDHRDLIIALAARHKLPAVYYERFYVPAGGLISYGADFADLYRRGQLRQPHPQRREAGRPSRPSTD